MAIRDPSYTSSNTSYTLDTSTIPNGSSITIGTSWGPTPNSFGGNVYYNDAVPVGIRLSEKLDLSVLDVLLEVDGYRKADILLNIPQLIISVHIVDDILLRDGRVASNLTLTSKIKKEDTATLGYGFLTMVSQMIKLDDFQVSLSEFTSSSDLSRGGEFWVNGRMEFQDKPMAFKLLSLQSLSCEVHDNLV